MPTETCPFPVEQNLSWEEDRKLILRGWALVFSTISILMALSVVDGRMVQLQGPYFGYLGFWINCRRHKCAHLGQVTALIHMSMGFIMLALALCVILLITMGVSFMSMFRRLNKIDLIFSALSFGIAFLMALSLTLFLANCKTMHRKEEVSYLSSFYMLWTATALMLWSGALSYLNYKGLWSLKTLSRDRRLSFFRWASVQKNLRRKSQMQGTVQSRSMLPLHSSITL